MCKVDVKEKFLEHIKYERRLSPRTVQDYGVSLNLFAQFLNTLAESRTLETADSDNIREWMESLMERNCSPAYVNRSLVALRTFYRYCLSMGIVSIDPARLVNGPKKPRRLPAFVNDSDMDRLDDILKQREQTFCNVRTRTIILVLYLTGLRAAELLSLDDEMIDFVSKEIKVTGKRDKQRIVPFGDDLLDILQEYISLRNREAVRTSHALFVDDKGERLTYDKLRRLVREHLALVTNQKKRSPHVLRHTFATTMLNHDANIESIRKLLGHQSLNATEIYTHTTFEQLRRIYNEAHPRS